MLIDLKQAINLIRSNDLVCIPTESVYGLAGNGLNDLAVAKIFSTKGRPSFNPLIMHVSDIKQVDNWVTVPPLIRQLIEYFWYKNPAPLTVILPLLPANCFSKIALAGQKNVALRRPNHPITLELLEHLNIPLAAPSANYSNQISATNITIIHANMSSNIPVLEGGPSQVGLESTIIGLVPHMHGEHEAIQESNKEKILIYRHGAVTTEMLQKFANVIDLKQWQSNNQNHMVGITPGSLPKHYAPGKPVYLNVERPMAGQSFLAFGELDDKVLSLLPQANEWLNLSPKGCLKEAAANLFAYLDFLDKNTSTNAIAVMPIPFYDIGKAINDRLERAAHSC